MLIDIHVHAGPPSPLTRPNGSRYPTGEELVSWMDENGIDKAVVLCCLSHECRYRFISPDDILAMSRRFPGRLIPFMNVDPRMISNSEKSDFRPLLSHYRDLGARGVGEYTPNLHVDDPLNLNVFAQLAELGLPLTIHLAARFGGLYGMVDEPGLPRLERVLRAFPDLRILGHSQVFWSEISADVTEETRSGYPKGPVTPGRVVELMRRYPNLLGDLSAGSGFNAVSRDEAFGLAFMNEFHDRLYFGTDICNWPQQTPIVEWFKALGTDGRLDADKWENIAWRNAARLFDLEN